MDQALQADGIGFQLREQPVGIPRLPQLVARCGEHLGAVPDDRCEHDDDDGVERGERQHAPADRQLAHGMKRTARGSVGAFLGAFLAPLRFMRPQLQVKPSLVIATASMRLIRGPTADRPASRRARAGWQLERLAVDAVDRP